MSEINEIKDFIERCKSPEFQKEVEEYRNCQKKKRNEHRKKNIQKYINHYKKYSLTEKGRYSISLKNSKRKKYFDTAIEGISWYEKHLIGRFYKNCPFGYVVDHIFPVSKGGKHTLSNLQYLTREENAKKSAKLNWLSP